MFPPESLLAFSLQETLSRTFSQKVQTSYGPGRPHISSVLSAGCAFGCVPCGALAQLGERLICIQEVIGSIPIGSTNIECDTFDECAKVFCRAKHAAAPG